MSQLHHIGIVCSDLRKSEKFYLENFNLEKIAERIENSSVIKQIFKIDSSANIIFLKAEDTLIELFHFPELGGLNSILGNISHFALRVDDPKKIFDKLKDEGLETIFINRGNRFIYFVKDPDGVLIELKE